MVSLERLVELAENADEVDHPAFQRLRRFANPMDPLVKCEAELLALEKMLKPASRAG